MSKSIKKALESCDMFGQPIQFSLHRKYLVKSSFGGVMTFLLITTFIIIAFQGFYDLINRSNITSFTQDVHYSKPPLIDFKSKGFSLAMAFNNFKINDQKFFKLEIFQVLSTTNAIGNK